jgi:hypothetical protein
LLRVRSSSSADEAEEVRKGLARSEKIRLVRRCSARPAEEIQRNCVASRRQPAHSLKRRFDLRARRCLAGSAIDSLHKRGPGREEMGASRQEKAEAYAGQPRSRIVDGKQGIALVPPALEARGSELIGCQKKSFCAAWADRGAE